jgi:hypothetical protein
MKTERRKYLRKQMLGFEEVVSATLRVEWLELIGTEVSDDSHGVSVSNVKLCIWMNIYRMCLSNSKEENEYLPL